jgi:uncharacterized protein YciI
VHIENINRLADMGKIFTAGPFAEKGKIMPGNFHSECEGKQDARWLPEMTGL